MDTERLILSSFTQCNENIHPENLQTHELSQLTNMVLDRTNKVGQPVKRYGFQRFFTTQLAAVPVSLFDVVDEANTNFLLAVNGTTIQRASAVGDSWTSVKTGLTTGLKHRMAAHNGRFIFTNDSDAPFIIGGTNLANTWNLEIVKPDIQGIVCGTASGGSLETDSRYRYVLVYKSDRGELSNPSIPFYYDPTDQDYESTSGANQTITLTSIPVSADTRVKSKMIFRTQANGNIFYLLTTLDNATTSYTDTSADTALDLATTIEFINVPTKAKYCAMHGSRLFLANITKTLSNIIVNKPAKGSLKIGGVDTNPGGAAIADGTYKWAESFVDGSGNESELSPYLQYTVDNSITGHTPGEARVALYGFSKPRIGAGEFDPNLFTRRLYRTKTGGSTFYFVKDFETTVTHSAVEDVAPDASLTVAYPYSGKGATTQQVMKCTVVCSEIDEVAEIRELFIFDIFSDDGDEITGILSIDNGLLVFKKYSICLLVTQDNPLNWQIQKIVHNIGCDEPNSILQVEDKVYFANNKQIFRFPDILNSPISLTRKPTFDTLSIYGATYDATNQWIIYVGTISTTHVIFIYDLKFGDRNSWYYFTLPSGHHANCAIMKLYGSNSGKLLLGGNRYVCDYDSAHTQDSQVVDTYVDISGTIRTKTFCFPDKISLARLRFLLANYNKLSDINTVFTITNPDTTVTNTYTESTGSGMTRFKTPIKSTDALKVAAKLYMQVVGAGEINTLRLEYYPISRGYR